MYTVVYNKKINAIVEKNIFIVFPHSMHLLQKENKILIQLFLIDRNTRSMIGLPDYKNKKFVLKELGYRYKPGKYNLIKCNRFRSQ